MNKLTNDILDMETDFQCEVEELVKQGRDFSDIYSLAIEILSTDKYKDLKLNDEYSENSLYDFVNETWTRYYE